MNQKKFDALFDQEQEDMTDKICNHIIEHIGCPIEVVNDENSTIKNCQECMTYCSKAINPNTNTPTNSKKTIKSSNGPKDIQNNTINVGDKVAVAFGGGRRAAKLIVAEVIRLTPKTVFCIAENEVAEYKKLKQSGEWDKLNFWSRPVQELRVTIAKTIVL